MTQYLLKILIVSFICFCTSLAQQFSMGSPEWLVDMFFSKSKFDDKANYFSGEMLNEINNATIGEELNGSGEVFFYQIKAKPDKIVFAVEVKQDKKSIEFYCYLIKESAAWKIDAVRRFLLPAFIYDVCDSLSQQHNLSSNDSVFNHSVQLFTSTDYELKNNLKENLNKFQELVSLFMSNLKSQADKALASVGCNAIYSDKRFPGCIFIQILKFETMEAGFISAADAMLIPEISVEEYIYIEEVVPGWFIYRVM
jgi:hypothetical protein